MREYALTKSAGFPHPTANSFQASTINVRAPFSRAGMSTDESSKLRLLSQLHFIPLFFTPVLRYKTRAPCEIAFYGGRVFVTTNITDEIIVLDRENGRHLGSVKVPPTMPMNTTLLMGATESRGKIFFTDLLGNRIGILDPNTLTAQLHRVPGLLQAPTGACSKCQCDLNGEPIFYFANFLSGNIGRFFSDKGTFEFIKIREKGRGLFPMPGLRGLVSDGNFHIWVCLSYANALAVYDERTGEVREIPLPKKRPLQAAPMPVDVAVGPDGNMWVSDAMTNRVIVYTKGGEFVRDFTFSAFSRPSRLAVWNDEVWVTLLLGNRVARIRDGRVEEFKLPHAMSIPEGITIDSVGDVWFTEWLGNRIGRIMRESGKLVEYDLPRPPLLPGAA